MDIILALGKRLFIHNYIIVNSSNKLFKNKSQMNKHFAYLIINIKYVNRTVMHNYCEYSKLLK